MKNEELFVKAITSFERADELHEAILERMIPDFSEIRRIENQLLDIQRRMDENPLLTDAQQSAHNASIHEYIRVQKELLKYLDKDWLAATGLSDED